MWDVWFLGQIVYSNIEHPSIINKIYLRPKGIPDLAKPKVGLNFQRVSNAEIHHWNCHDSRARDQTIGMKV